MKPITHGYKDSGRLLGRGLPPKVEVLREWLAALPVTVLGACLLFGQQTHTSSAPVFSANAKYVQGVGPGYWPTPGSGLSLNIAPGTAYCGTAPVTYSGGALTMAASATNYVFLNPAAACAPEVNTTGFALGQIPIATVVTSEAAISSVVDLRTWFSPLPCTVSSSGATTCAALGSNQDVLLTPSGTGNVLLPRLNNIRFADQFSGTTAGEKIAAAIADLPATGGVVDARGFTGAQTINGLTVSKRVTLLFGNATFDVSAKIRLQNVAGVRIEGQAGSAPGYGAQTVFYWTGNSTDPMFELDDVAYSVFKHFTIRADTSYPLKYAFQMFNGSGTSVVPTGRMFEDIWIQGTNGSIEAGFKYNIGAGGDAGNDFDTFYRVVGANYSDALWRIDAGQSKFHRMYSCLASGNRIGKAAVKTDTSTGGSFEWYGGGGGGHTEADFWIGAPNDTIKIDSGNWENSTRFLIMPAYATASAPVLVESNRWAADYLHADGKAIYDEGRGPLVLIGNRFIHNTTAPALQIWCYDWSGTQATANHVAIGNVIVSSLSNPFTGGEWTLLGNSVSSTPGYPLGTVLPNSLELELISPSAKNSASDPTTLYLRHYTNPDNKYLRFYDDGSNAHMTRSGGGYFYFEGADRYIFSPNTVFQGEFQQLQPYGTSHPKPSGTLRLSATDASGNERTFDFFSTTADGIVARSALASLPTFTFKRLPSQASDLTRWLSEDGSTVLARMTAAGDFVVNNGDVGIGTTPSMKLDVSGNIRASGQLLSTAATGTPPLVVSSTTEVANLNADRIGGTEITNSASGNTLLLGTGTGAAAWTSNPLGLPLGGTNRSSWTAGRCVRVNDAGTALEPANSDCGTGGGGGDVTAVGDCAYGDCFQTVTANYVLAAPSSGGPGQVSARALVAADIPGLDAAKITSGSFGFSRGGTNQTSWTPSRCVRVNDAGTALEPAADDCGTGGGGGDNISVNGTAATDADFDDATPSAPSNAINVKWQKDASSPNNVSAYVPYASPLAVAAGNLTCPTCEVTGNKNAANGYAGLDSGARIAKAQAPSTTVYTDGSNTWSTGTQDWTGVSASRPFRRLAYSSFPGSCTANQDMLVRTDPATAGHVIYICNSSGTGWDLVGDGGGSGTEHNLLSSTHTDTTAASPLRGAIITGQGTTPTWARLALGAAGKYLKSDGTDIGWSAGAASGTGACSTNQWVSTLNGDAAPTCTQPGFSNLSGSATLSQLPYGSANQILGTNSAGTAIEHKTLSTGTSGSDFGIAHAANSVTFNLPVASASNTGKLSSTDWTTFNNKVATSRTLTAGTGLSGGGDLSADRTFAFDSTELNSNLTWGSGSAASLQWDFSLSGSSDPQVIWQDGQVTFNRTLRAPDFQTTGTAAGKLDLYEASANGNNYFRLQVPDSITSDYTATWAVTSYCSGTNGGALTINSSNQIVCSDDDGGAGSGDITAVGDCPSGDCYQSVTANYVLAAPNGSSGQVSARALVANDIPNLDAAKITSGVFGAARGGTNNAYFQVSGPASTVKTFTFPNADATIEYQANKNAASGYAGLTSGTKLIASQGQEVWAVADLTDFASKSGSGTTAIGSTITSPQDNQCLIYSSGNWVNATCPGGGGGISSLNGLTASTQYFGTPGTSGTAPNWSSVTDTHTLNIPMASSSGVTAGLISKTQYDTFNSKQAGDGDLTAISNLSSTGFARRTGTDTWTTAAASGTGSCTNQVVTGLNDNAAPTCSNVSSAMIQDETVATADVAAILKTRQLAFMVGADNGAALADTDDQATIWVNRLGQGVTIQEVWCDCDAGSPTIQLQKDDGSPTNMLSSNLTCSSGAGASTTSFVSGENAIANGDRVDFVMVTAGGTAKRITVNARYTLN